MQNYRVKARMVHAVLQQTTDDDDDEDNVRRSEEVESGNPVRSYLRQSPTSLSDP